LLISTTALSPTAVAILLARVLNAPHCLHASIATTTGPACPDFCGGGEAVFLTVAGFLALTDAAFFFGGALDEAEKRAARAMVVDKKNRTAERLWRIAEGHGVNKYGEVREKERCQCTV
jgi:hypothetical protein